jgi:glycosyltransferase involved in cell wall biosynthesis
MNKFLNINFNYSTTRRLRKINSLVTSVSFNKKLKSNNYFKNQSSFLKKPVIEEGGLRTLGYVKRATQNVPLVTIITVVLNGARYLEKTILSVINQTYDNIEYIIIDGKSRDSSVKIILKYNNMIDYWVSEKDGGLYDAMNKAVKLSSGSVLYFLNAGDIIIDGEFFSLVKNFQKNLIKYGSEFILFGTHKYEGKFPGLKGLPYFMPFLGRLPSHQAMLIPKKLQLKYLYDRQFSVSADKDFKIKTYLAGVKYVKKPYCVCLSLAGGLSQAISSHKVLTKRTNEMFRIFKKNFNFIWALTYSVLFYIWNLRKIKTLF